MPRVDDRKKEYDVLGLETSANEVEVKKAFSRLALRYHPDSNSSNKGIDQEKKIKYTEVCKAYKKIMAHNYDNCSFADWNNDKSDEIFFSLLGELIQNSTRTSELFTLLSAQGNNKSQFQNDNEYRCKEDAMEDDEEAELNKLVDILKNRLQNGKSVPAGLTQEKLTRLKDDFMKQKEEFKKAEKNHHTPNKKMKTTTTVPVAKPKPKSKKQLQAEQRRRELEMASIAKELEEKKKKEGEKEQERKKHEQERKKQLDEEKRKQEEDKKRQLNENKKKKEREEKEREQRMQKEKERMEQLKKTQEEEQRKKEEEKRRKAEDKAAKQKSLKETKEREEKDKLEKQQSQKNQKQRTQNQYQQQQQQQQQKYPREVPPRFLRQQQMKQQSGGGGAVGGTNRTSQENNYYDNASNNQYMDHNSSGWTEILPDANVRSTHISTTEDWDLDIDYYPKEQSTAIDNRNGFQQSTTILTTDSSWGGIPASEDWDLDIANQSRSSDFISSNTTLPESSSNKSLSESTAIGNEAKMDKVVKNLFSSNSSSNEHLSSVTAINTTSVNFPAPNNVNTNNPSWGVSLTGSSWNTANTSVRQSDSSSNISKTSMEQDSKTPVSNVTDNKTQLSSSTQLPNESRSVSSSHSTNNLSQKQSQKSLVQQHKQLELDTSCPGITSWAGLDSFEGGPVVENVPKASGGGGGTKPKNIGNYAFNRSINHHTNQKDHHHNNNSNKPMASIDSKIDSNLKVSGWLQNTSQSTEDWDEGEKQDEDFGWTTVKTNKKLTTCSQGASAPNTPSKQDGANAWTNRALKQLLDMGFKKEQAEKALRDNNGIIESAVSDLLLKADLPDNSAQSGSNSSSKNQTNNATVSNDPTDSTNTTPQKLNRKQRRKLQQMQNAEQNIGKSPTESSTLSHDNTNAGVSQQGNILVQQRPAPSDKTGANLKLNGDGLLPTPPASQRIVSNDNKPDSSSKDSIGNMLPDPDTIGVIQKPVRPQKPIGQEAASMKQQETSQPSQPHPIGFSRPQQYPIQPPAPIQPPNSSQSVTIAKDNSVANMTNTDLPPPVNPVLLAQMHLQKLGLEDSRTNSSSFPTHTASMSQSQPVTNSYIQQYLQRMSQAPDIETSMTGLASSISTPLLSTSSMSLSRLLPQPPVPASSLSDGPQKSKLLQWTQPSSTSNSEPTTPPPDDKDKCLQKIDPVSAKWGVVAAPRLSPTPAEFKPGVPWRSRGASTSDAKDDELADFVDSVASVSDLPSCQEPERLPSPLQTLGMNDHPPPIHHPKFVSMPPSNSQQIINEPTPIRPPPGLHSDGTSIESTGDASWMVLKGLQSMAMSDPSSLRSLCQQFGTLLHFRMTSNLVCVCYETPTIAKNACLELDGKMILDQPIVAEVSTELDCSKFLESHGLNNGPVLINGNSQSTAPGPFPNISSFGGGLWTTPPGPLTQSPSQQFVQHSFPYANGPSNLGMNGGFGHWGVSNSQTLMQSSNPLWGPSQPVNVFQPYPSGWLNSKPEPVPSSVFSPGMDRCLPSELLNFNKEQSS